MVSFLHIKWSSDKNRIKIIVFYFFPGDQNNVHIERRSIGRAALSERRAQLSPSALRARHETMREEMCPLKH